jgi:hypothetical protein
VNGQGSGQVQRRPILTPEIISRLEEKGYDVSEARTALQNHDLNATRAWVDAFRKTNPGVLASLQPAGPGSLQGNETGNSQGPTNSGPDQVNNPGAGQVQDQSREPHILTPEFISRLRQNGYDVKEVTTALRTWLSDFLKSHGHETISESTQ